MEFSVLIASFEWTRWEGESSNPRTILESAMSGMTGWFLECPGMLIAMPVRKRVRAYVQCSMHAQRVYTH